MITPISPKIYKLIKFLIKKIYQTILKYTYKERELMLKALIYVGWEAIWLNALSNMR